MNAVELLSAIEQRMTAPSARGLATAVSAVIGAGQLAVGEKLPPVRVVARQLGLSPTTVSSAWAMLQRGGVIATGGRSGTRVAARHAQPSRYRSALTHGSDAPEPAQRPPFAMDLSTGTPDVALLPSLVDVLRRVRPPDEPSSYLDDPVLPELADLLRADWPFPADRITVVDGAMDALELITAAHLRFGDAVGVEDPCFPPLLDLLEAVGARPIPMTLDQDGVRPEEMRRAVDTGVRAVFLQPRGQNPTGVSTSAARLAEHAEILRGTRILVIEDDSLGAIAATPDVSLGSLLPETTVHVRSYSKSHGPDLRLAALVGPQGLVQPIVERRFLGQGWTSRLLQRVLVHLITEPESIAAVAAARVEYARRRTSLIALLADRGVPVGGSDGLNLWVPVADETAALLSLAAHSLGASAGRPFMVRDDGPPHIRVTSGLVGGDLVALADAIGHAAGARRHTLAR